jgi:hypothetical protein
MIKYKTNLIMTFESLKAMSELDLSVLKRQEYTYFNHFPSTTIKMYNYYGCMLSKVQTCYTYFSETKIQASCEQKKMCVRVYIIQ